MTSRTRRSRQRFAPAPSAPPPAPLAYLVKLSHDMPSLDNIPMHLWPQYTVTLPKGTATLSAQTIVLARVTRGRLSLHSVPSGVTNYQVWLSYTPNVPNAQTILPIAHVLGFTFYTSAEDFFTRACSFLNAQMLPDALREYDLALTLCAQAQSEISDTLELHYARYAKLRNLALGSSESHESTLACKHALRAASQIWTQLNRSNTHE